MSGCKGLWTNGPLGLNHAGREQSFAECRHALGRVCRTKVDELGSQTGDKVSSMHDRTGACILRLPELDSRKDIDRVVACYLALNCSVIGCGVMTFDRTIRSTGSQGSLDHCTSLVSCDKQTVGAIAPREGHLERRVCKGWYSEHVVCSVKGYLCAGMLGRLEAKFLFRFKMDVDASCNFPMCWDVLDEDPKYILWVTGAL
ncbi:hypothetical protein An09g02190 [Aspergillus niger]|uniref:Uncharacterized protein n=2 Tax=Aspergillus niger TaxID=5061 RepID=A2QTI1_ASPNC|nr:hypothetical protein An09g02190 [Aspergillus niger]CAK40156.1 hypothetical protein An09g02190 [Aspergillus niger]